jgi:CheY-specific phosphatase CheX
MNKQEPLTTTLIKSLLERCRGFLVEELGCPVKATSLRLDDLPRVQVKPMTSMVSLGGEVNMLIAFSFDEALLQRLMTLLTEDIEIEEGEESLYLEDAACEIINTVVGNSTADVQTAGAAIPLSPPLMISGGKSLTRHRDAKFYEADMETDIGNLKLLCIGPRDLFDESLNYVE